MKEMVSTLLAHGYKECDFSKEGKSYKKDIVVVTLVDGLVVMRRETKFENKKDDFSCYLVFFKGKILTENELVTLLNIADRS